MQIRAAVPHDLPAVQALLREAELPLDGVADQVTRDRLCWARSQGLSSVAVASAAPALHTNKPGPSRATSMGLAVICWPGKR
ncbi:hypothetical protein BH23GEM5_BH23GEM5_24240 [soil metagenome]